MQSMCDITHGLPFVRDRRLLKPEQVLAGRAIERLQHTYHFVLIVLQ
jgi:hypothetical protein